MRLMKRSNTKELKSEDEKGITSFPNLILYVNEERMKYHSIHFKNPHGDIGSSKLDDYSCEANFHQIISFRFILSGWDFFAV